MKVVTEIKECPYCGRENSGAMNGIVREETAKGNIGEGKIGATSIAVYSVVDSTKPPIAGGRIPSIRVYTDICTGCLRAFNFRMEKGHMTIPVSPSVPPVFS